LIFDNQIFNYDLIYLLTKASPRSRSSAQLAEDVVNHHTEGYGYDPVGNRNSGPKSTDNYTYNTGNEQLSYNGKILLLNTNEQNEYDPNGNLIKKTQTEGKIQTVTCEFDGPRTRKIMIKVLSS
jgi:YD repeat-containing protein